MKVGPTIRVHQLLHGYLDGHRQLAASIELSSPDARTVLTLSDSAGPISGEADYLTGYPLSDLGMYALARTWSAPEMPRPGCVWTQTLLVDFSDLAVLTDPSCLLSAFKRPVIGNVLPYRSELVISQSEGRSGINPTERLVARRWLIGLYENPDARVVGTSEPNVRTDELVLAIWAQQWPRLRRAFRFCTRTGVDRSSDGAPFDLQVLSEADRGFRSRFAGALHANDELEFASDKWLKDALQDLEESSPHELRTFLQRVGSDVPSGRRGFIALCELYDLLRDNSSQSDTGRAIALLDNTLASAQARIARAEVARMAVIHVVSGSADESILAFAIQHLSLLSHKDLNFHAAALGRAIWDKDPASLIALLQGNKQQVDLAIATLQVLPIDTLESAFEADSTILRQLIPYRRDILDRPSFWSEARGLEDEAFESLHKSDRSPRHAITAMSYAGRGELAKRAVFEFGSTDVAFALNVAAPNLSATKMAAWAASISVNSSELASLLITEGITSRSFLVALARVFPSNTLSDTVTYDPWLIAWRSSQGDLPESEYLDFQVFLLARGLDKKSRHGEELVLESFDDVYRAALRDRLSSQSWWQLEKQLPRPLFSFVWDRRALLQTEVVNRFVHGNWTPKGFLQLVTDDKIFSSLVTSAAHTVQGRAYLLRAQKAALGIKKCSHRAETIAHALQLFPKQKMK